MDTSSKEWQKIVREKRHFSTLIPPSCFLTDFCFYYFLTVVPESSTVPSKRTTEIVQEGITTGTVFF